MKYFKVTQPPSSNNGESKTSPYIGVGIFSFYYCHTPGRLLPYLRLVWITLEMHKKKLLAAKRNVKFSFKHLLINNIVSAHALFNSTQLPSADTVSCWSVFCYLSSSQVNFNFASETLCTLLDTEAHF